MKLYSSLGPNPRLVRMFLVEKDIEVERIHFDIITGENRSDDYAKKNVMQTTPALELDNGTLLSESTVICEYLEEIKPGPVLIGSTPEERAETRRWARRIDQEIAVPMTLGFRGGAGRPMFEPRMNVVSTEAAAELSSMSDKHWIWLDGQLGSKDHICNGKLTLADLVAFCFIKFGGTVGWSLPAGTDNLARFAAMMEERPSAEIWRGEE
ncbi:glutathione S-transferase family protein [Parasphingorhabdus halotolerans]|uniref:Glutathione S-transferase family protein n=1 Tax=Parasphingorhabdus halotolerans TaxID=2725558 RepID=A0A6H2DP55_9SPHN|nr:glutathione S-transferase family protein [Parasphingorhabdus halotolerans]QJB70170.1 glutathione S-transferase family protein [Parasphingorhabdus halotolerans]